MALVTVYHPTFAETTEQVEKEDVSQWTEAGWRTKPLDAPKDDGNPAVK